MQVALFEIGLGDAKALEELNRFLRGQRVLTLDREPREGGWSFCVTYLPAAGGGSPAGESRAIEKVDYKAVLDAATFALFAKLRELRKALAEKEALPAYAVFTNEQLAEIAKARCRTAGELGKVDGVGAARIEKYGAQVVAVVTEHEGQPTHPGKDRGA
jgi:superfamily II DNA helicase RecQ